MCLGACMVAGQASQRLPVEVGVDAPVTVRLWSCVPQTSFKQVHVQPSKVLAKRHSQASSYVSGKEKQVLNPFDIQVRCSLLQQLAGSMSLSWGHGAQYCVLPEP